MGLGKTLQSICIIAGDHYMRGVQFRVISLHCVLAYVMDESISKGYTVSEWFIF